MCACISQASHVCFVCIHRVFCMDFLLSLPASWQHTWEPLHWPQQTWLRPLPRDNLNSRIMLLRVVSKKAKQETFFPPDRRAFWNFWRSVWTFIKRVLVSVWICRRGGQIKQTDVEITCFQHLYSLMTSPWAPLQIITELDIQRDDWDVEIRQIKITWPFSRHPKGSRPTTRELCVFHCLL